MRLRCRFGFHRWRACTWALGYEAERCECDALRARAILDGVPLGPWRRVKKWPGSD